MSVQTGHLKYRHLWLWMLAIGASVLFHMTAATAQQANAGKTLTIIVPFTPGSGSDTLARALAPALRDRLNQIVVVENRTGASGNIGTYGAARATPDGTTLLLTANTIVLNVGLFKNLNYDPIKSFVPIMEVATGHMALVAHPSLGVSNLQESWPLRRSPAPRSTTPVRAGERHIIWRWSC